MRESSGGAPALILLATGSEVQIACDAELELTRRGIKTRVVSMPSWELFENQSAEYREQVLPRNVEKRISIEAASTFGWDRYVGPRGVILGMSTFGESAPMKDVLQYFGFTVENVVKNALKLF